MSKLVTVDKYFSSTFQIQSLKHYSYLHANAFFYK